MATGDQNDILNRIDGLIPPSWFGSASPNLTALLSGLASMLAWVYSLIAYVQNQCRIATATDGFLDLISADFFGPNLPRNAGETDTAFRARIQANLLRPRATRAGLIATVQTLTGTTPRLFEPQRPMDTGGWGGNPYGGYGVAGGYTNPALCRPNQALMTITPGNGVSDAAIAAAVDQAKPAGTIIWITIQHGLNLGQQSNSQYVPVLFP
jgi:hypothetical protein